MAKIGNEAKLILILAKSKMCEKKSHVLTGSQEAPWNKGYQDCFRDYQKILDSIVMELEGKI